jgi:hypothetical protein
VKQWCTEADWRSRRTPHARQVTTLSIRRSIGYARAHVFLFVVQRETLSAKQQRDYPWRFFLLGAASLENAIRYVRKAYVPLQLLISRRLPCGAAGETSSTPPAWRFFSQRRQASRRGSIRNECVRTPTVALLQTSRERDSLQTSAERFTCVPGAFFSRDGKLIYARRVRYHT